MRWLLIAHSIPGLESEFENFARFLSTVRPSDNVEMVGLPLRRQLVSTSRRGHVVEGKIPEETKSYLFGPPLHAVPEVAFPCRSRADVLIAFDPISVLHGRKSRARRTVLWGIDFVPTRGHWLLDTAFRRLERCAMKRVHLQIENTDLARAARQETTSIVPHRSLVVPITIDTSIFSPNRQDTEVLRLAFLGGLNRRTGADRLVPIFLELDKLGARATLDVIGSGPLLNTIRAEVKTRGFDDRVCVHGFVNDDEEVARLLSRCTIGLAPFAANDGDFTWFTDPQKVKFYLAAGLHVVMTDAPPVATSVEDAKAGSLLSPTATAKDWALQLLKISKDTEQLRSSQAQARELAQRFERSVSYNRVLKEILDLL